MSIFYTGSIAAVGLVAITVAGKMFGPSVEQAFIQPINDLTFNEFVCVDDDVILRGVLDKAVWPGGQEAEFLGLTLLSVNDKARIAWRRVDTTDNSPASRPGGIQPIDLYAVGACGVPFTAHTKHASPATGLVLRMTFGPFQVPTE